MGDLGWDSARACFVDHVGLPIETLFKLYPWKKLLGEPFGPHALTSIADGQKPQHGRTHWIEPVGKMLWSNKALLAILWELYSDHELLLPAYLDSSRGMTRHVRTPLFGSEGANITIMDGESRFETEGSFPDGPWLYQVSAPVVQVAGNWTVLGAWLVDGEPYGLGMRESCTPVIRNTDRFVPHLVRLAESWQQRAVRVPGAELPL